MHDLTLALTDLGFTPAEIRGMTPRQAATIARGVSGAEDSPVPPPADPAVPVTDPAATPAPVVDPAAPPAPPAAVPDPNAPPVDPDALPDVPDPGQTDEHGNVANPEALAALHATPEADLRAAYAILGSIWDRERPGAEERGAEAAQRLIEVRARQQIAAGELQRRRDAATAAADRLNQLDVGGAPALPDPSPAFASAASVAGARGGQPPAAQNPPSPGPSRPRVAAVASAGPAGGGAGQEPMTLSALGAAIDAVKNSPGDGEIYLAQLPSYTDMRARVAGAADVVPEPLSIGHGATKNDALIAEAVEDWRDRKAGRAPRQGTICGPFDIIRDIPSEFVTDEPVSDIWPSRPATRLGFQYTPSIHMSDVQAGVAGWTDANQALVDPTLQSTWKPIVDITCPTPLTVKAQAVTAALRFDNTTEMSLPERIANATKALQAQKARAKEGQLLSLLDALSSAYHFSSSYGALATLIEAVNTLLAQAEYVDRLGELEWTMIIPPGVLALLSIDRANRAYGEDIPKIDVLKELSAGLDGVTSVVETLDASTNGEPGLPFAALNPAGQLPIPIPTLATDQRIRLVAPEAAIYSETGDLYVGVQRSPELLRQNKAIYFEEEYFLFAKHGPQPWLFIDVALCPNGGRAGLINPYTCAKAS